MTRSAFSSPRTATRALSALAASALLGLPLLSACSDEGSTGGDGGMGGLGSGPEPSLSIGLGGDSGGNGIGGSGSPGPWKLPDGFNEADLGGYQVGDEIVDAEPGSSGGSGNGGNGSGGSAGVTDDCGTEIVGILRDFKRGDKGWDGHSDFETYTGNGEKGIVEPTLGPDRKPVHAPGDHKFTTSEEEFDQWYRNVEGVNRAYLTTFSFEPHDGVSTFKSSAFFPLDGLGFGNQELGHNFHFTTEIHTAFVYRGGETFTFTGDDDLWVFIDDRLAIDLGGLHPELTETIKIDDIAEDFGLEKGTVYPLDLFHAERHTGESNFRVDTTLRFTSCNIVVDDVAVK